MGLGWLNVSPIRYNTLNNKRKEAKMTTPKIGETFTTAKSGVSGKVEEVVKNANGSLRVRLDVGGKERWTTIK